MAHDGFNTNELDEFSRDLLSLATTALPRETKKMLKKEATKLSKIQKNKIKSLGIGELATGLVKKTKAGKVYKYNGDLTCRAYSGGAVKGKGSNYYSLSGMINNGYLRRGGVNHEGAETYVPGYKYMESSQSQFSSIYNQDLQNFIDDMLDNNEL